MNKTNKLFVLSALWLGFASVALAQLPNASAPDIGAGKKRATVCFACHGANGISKIPGTPHLAGQQRAYLEKALHAYREGQTRQDPTMTAMARPLSDADIVNISAYFFFQTRVNSGQTAEQVIATYERIRPVGRVQTGKINPTNVVTTTASAATPVAARSGDQVFVATCTGCHSTGAAGAPKLGDKAAWAPRTKKGKPVLYANALKGFNAMPPKGACATCSDNEIKAATDFMLSKAK